MNKIFDTSAVPPFVPDFRYVILVGSVPLSGFDRLDDAEQFFESLLNTDLVCSVSLLYNSHYGDNKEASDV